MLQTCTSVAYPTKVFFSQHTHKVALVGMELEELILSAIANTKNGLSSVFS